MTTETIKLYENIKISELEDSEIEIEGEISTSAVPTYRTKALKKFGESTSIDGFRKGHVPEKVLIEKIGEGSLMSEVAEMALSDMYPTLVRDKNLDVIGAPQVTITKLANGNPIGFKIKTAVLPKFALPDYKKIAKTVMGGPDDLDVTETDVERVLIEVRRGKARFEEAKKQADNNTKNTNESEKNDHPKTPIEQETKVSKGEDEDLPELDDDFISTLGEFKTLDDFKIRVKEDLLKEKTQKAREKKRITLSEEMIDKTDLKLPKILVESELDKMIAQMKDDVARMGMKFEDYLTHVKKSEEDLRGEWKEQAEKRASLQLILNKIAIEGRISAPEKDVEHEVKHILEHFKDANPDNVRIYVETQLTNEEIFKSLEKKEEKTE